MSAVFGIPAIAVVATLGVLIMRINRRWWLQGSLIASWPLYLAAAIILWLPTILRAWINYPDDPSWPT